jgi:hypothetical protein
MNALAFFNFYEDTAVPINAKSKVVVAKILNIGVRSVRKIEKKTQERRASFHTKVFE